MIGLYFWHYKALYSKEWENAQVEMAAIKQTLFIYPLFSDKNGMPKATNRKD